MKALILASAFLVVSGHAVAQVAKTLIPSDSKDIRISSFNETKIIVGTKTVPNPNYPCQGELLSADCSERETIVYSYAPGYRLSVQMETAEGQVPCAGDNCYGAPILVKECEVTRGKLPGLPKLSGWRSNSKLAKELFRLEVKQDSPSTTWLLIFKNRSETY